MERTTQHKQTTLVGCALLGGATLFAAAAVLLPLVLDQKPAESTPEQNSLVRMLSWVHAAVFASSVVAAFLLPARLPKGATGGRSPEIDPRLIIKWALLEGAALFGTVVVLLAGLEGLLPRQTLLYSNLISYTFFAAVVLKDVLAPDTQAV